MPFLRSITRFRFGTSIAISRVVVGPNRPLPGFETIPRKLQCNPDQEDQIMKPFKQKLEQRLANIRWGLAAMLLGLPLPVVLLAFLFGGCNGH